MSQFYRLQKKEHWVTASSQRGWISRLTVDHFKAITAKYGASYCPAIHAFVALCDSLEFAGNMTLSVPRSDGDKMRSDIHAARQIAIDEAIRRKHSNSIMPQAIVSLLKRSSFSKLNRTAYEKMTDVALLGTSQLRNLTFTPQASKSLLLTFFNYSKVEKKAHSFSQQDIYDFQLEKEKLLPLGPLFIKAQKEARYLESPLPTWLEPFFRFSEYHVSKTIEANPPLDMAQAKAEMKAAVGFYGLYLERVGGESGFLGPDGSLQQQGAHARIYQSQQEAENRAQDYLSKSKVTSIEVVAMEWTARSRTVLKGESAASLDSLLQEQKELTSSLFLKQLGTDELKDILKTRLMASASAAHPDRKMDALRRAMEEIRDEVLEESEDHENDTALEGTSTPALSHPNFQREFIDELDEADLPSTEAPVIRKRRLFS